MADNEPFVPNYQTCDEVTELCPVEFTVYGTRLNKPAALFFMASFALFLVAQVYFGYRNKAWGFMIWLGLGTILEIIGYDGRRRLSDNPWSIMSFIISYITILLAPTLVAASISVTFKSIVIWYGPQWSLLRPTLYPWVFVGTDFLSILIQVIGGGAVAAATTGSNNNRTIAKLGEGLVVGGVAFQVANMVACGGLMLLYMKRRKAAQTKGVGLMDEQQAGPGFLDQRSQKGIPMNRLQATDKEASRVKMFLYALAVAYVCIIVRCAYRISENVSSIRLDVLRNEGLFLALDGGMLLVAIGLVTVFHPYNFFPFLGVSRRERDEFDYKRSIRQAEVGLGPMDPQPEPVRQGPPPMYLEGRGPGR